MDPGLAERVSLPVDGAHVRNPYYVSPEIVYRRRAYPLAEAQAAPAADVPPGASPDLFCFGLGTGDGVARLAARPGVERVMAWERDPWLLRVALSRHDFAQDIRSGRVRFLLGADLLVATEALARGAVRVDHPVLGEIYRDEAALLAKAGQCPVAFLAEGELFVDDVSSALRQLGFGVFRFYPTRLSREEMAYSARRLHPALVFSVNWVHSLSDLCAEWVVPYACWEIDPSLDSLAPPRKSAARTHVFTYRKPHVEEFQRQGYPHAEYLPLATAPERRRPVRTAADSAFQAPVSFVGASMKKDADKARALFLQGCALYRRHAGGLGPAETEAALDALLAAQARDYSRYRVPALAFEHFGDFLRWCSANPKLWKTLTADSLTAVDPLLLLGEIAASNKRLDYVGELGRFGIRVWGDEGWQACESRGAKWMGPADHFHDLNAIYSGSIVNIDIGRIYQDDIVTMRVFDVMACGGFVLAEDTPALREVLRPGEELGAYTDLPSLLATVEACLAHPDLVRKTARRGREAVLRRHSILERVRYIVSAL